MGITLANITISGFIDIESVFVPTAPTIGTAERVSGSGTEIDVPYTASANNGGRVITSYTAVSNPGNITGTISQASSGTIRVGGLTQGTAYTFVVYATNGVGNSPNSAASNSVIPAIVPTAPTIGTPLNVSGSGTEIDVPYTASSSDGGLPITSYTATSTPGSITGTLSQASSGTIRVSGLTQGTSYTFVVKATNVVGDSPNSAASSAITPGIVPSAPTIGTVIRVSGSGTSLDVPYTASASNGGLPITSYTATSTPGSLTGTISQASSGTIRVTGLTQGTNYTFVVKATNTIGDSPNSAASNSIAPAVVPDAPTIGTASRVGGSGTSLNITYTAPSSNGGNAITSYTAVSTPGSITGTISQASSGTINVTGLTQGTNYTFVVYATNSVGNSPNSAASNSIAPAVVPTAPTIGTPTNVGGSGTSINVPYTASASNGGNAITSYTATSTPGSITGTLSQASSGTIVVSGLTQGTSYTFVVKATNSIGDSPNSAASSAITPAVVPTAPTIGTPARVSGSGTSIDVPYTASASNGGVAITSYTAVSTPGSITGTLSQASSGTIRVAGLTQGTSYTFVVYATNSVGNSPNSSASSAIIPATTPSAPTIGTATVLSNTSASVSFTAGSNGGNAITSFTATSTPGSLTGTVSQASSGSITVTGLTQGTSYTFVVKATNSLGDSPNSAASNAITPSNPPSQATVGTVSFSSGLAIVPFTAPANGGSAITTHTAVSYPDNFTVSVSQASSGSITMSNAFIVNQSYSFTVFATNSAGAGPASTASNTVTATAVPINAAEYTTPGSYSWIAPAGVTSVSVVTIGGGGGGGTSGTAPPPACKGGTGGGGGGLAWLNGYPVTAGSPYSVTVGVGGTAGCRFNQGGMTAGGTSFFVNTSIASGSGGPAGTGGPGVGGGGHTVSTAYGTRGGGCGGGSPGRGGSRHSTGGGGAAGYSGAGGQGGGFNSPGSSGAGGGGGGGGGGYNYTFATGNGSAASGGGVGIYGQGPSGGGGPAGGYTPSASGFTTGGSGGSGGAEGGGTTNTGGGGGGGGLFGGGGGGCAVNSLGSAGYGGNGAVRILWGTGRSFPSTNVCSGVPQNFPLQTTVGTVTTSPSTITVPFTAAGANGGTITSHRAISTPGNVVATLNQASSGSIVYSNNTLLSNNTAYTFTVYAVNAAGAGPQSPASNSITYIV